MLELIRGRCGNVYGDLFALMTILKGLPIGYNRDLQEDKRIIFRAYDMVDSCLTMAAAIVDSAHFDQARIEPTLDRGFLDATSLAEYFVTKGIPFRTAHQIVGSLVARCEREGKTQLSQLSVEDFRQVAHTIHKDASGNATAESNAGGAGSGDSASGVVGRIGPDIHDALGARNVVARYQSTGAGGGTPFREQLAMWKAKFGV
jgi:argininosuccinate lyase